MRKVTGTEVVFDVDGIGSDPFAENFYNSPSYDADYDTGLLSSLILPGADDDENRFTPATDAVNNVVEQFASLQTVFRKMNIYVPATVGISMSVMSSMVSAPPVDSEEVTNLHK